MLQGAERKGETYLVSLLQSSSGASHWLKLWEARGRGETGEGSSQSRAGEGYKVHLRPDGQLTSSGVRVAGSTEDRVGQSMPSGGAHCV